MKEFFEAVVSTPFLAGILILSALAMGIRSILYFTREATALQPRLNELERELKKRWEGTQELKKNVNALVQQITPLREQEAKYRQYYEELQTAYITAEKQEHQKSQEEMAERRKRIQRKRMGFD